MAFKIVSFIHSHTVRNHLQLACRPIRTEQAEQDKGVSVYFVIIRGGEGVMEKMMK